MAQTKNPFQTPFLDADVEKLFTNFKLPGLDIDEVLKAQRKNIEALTEANQLAVEGLQTAFLRQGEIISQIVNDTSEITRQLLAEGTPEDKAIKQTEQFKKVFESTLSNVKELNEIVANANQEAADVINKRVASSLAEVKQAIEKTKKKKAAA